MGFMALSDMRKVAATGVLAPVPEAVLVSPGVLLGDGVILWPNVILQILPGGGIEIGSGAVLFPGTRIVASGRVRVGPGAEIGDEGGFTIKAEDGNLAEIGAGARLLGGGSLSGSNRIGRGAQILGPIRCRNCRLGDGTTYRDPEPDERGGVLKGSGVAYDVNLPCGTVIQAFGLFSEGVVRPQSYFHPRRDR